MKEPEFTLDDLDAVYKTKHQVYHFLDLLNGELTIEEARENIKSLIGSEYDPRTKNSEQ